MVAEGIYDVDREVTWCPGCGNYPILATFKQALRALALEPARVLIVSGIGQAGKMDQYVNANSFNVLHGRTLPVATGAAAMRPDLKVIAVGGDGDGYAEGGNHIIHAARRNADVTYFVHNNQVYGLTKGQASPTTELGTRTTTTPRGNPSVGFNPIPFLLGIRTTFVARGYAGNQEQLLGIMRGALSHRGFAVVDILQPCVTFNKVNTWEWYGKRVYDVAEVGHDPTDLAAAYGLAVQWGERIPTGVLYAEERASFRSARGLDEGMAPVEVGPDHEAVRATMRGLW